jgi:CubicO group peptidase (beta-lactamase class C family)
VTTLAGVVRAPASPSEAEDLGEIARLVVEDLGASPCAVVAAARRDGARFRFGVGVAGRLWAADDAPPATTTTPFDLASLTKPVTALTLARLERAGALSRGERLSAVLPALAGTASAETPIDLLAAHRGGLDGHRPLYAPLVDGREVDRAAALREAADARRVDAVGPAPAEGFAPVYSDLGYLLVGEAIAARGGDDVDRVMEREVTAPLGLAIGSARALRARDPRFDQRVAPTEFVPWRGGTVRGAVHDENAFALARDAAAGHAGLFGDALSVAALGATLLRALDGEVPGWLGPDDLAPLVRDRPGGSLLAGFDRRSGDAPSSGARFGRRTFGHLGFTGTSVWIDPDAGLVGVLLTNRVHPTRAADAIRRARPAAYDAMAERLT